MPTGQIGGELETRTVTMDSDLSAKECFLVTLDTTDNNNVNLAANSAAPVFVLYEGADGSVAKATGSIVISGRVLVKLGGTVAPGDRLTSDGSGKAIATVTDKQNYAGIAMQIGAADDLVEMSVERGLISAT